MYFLYRSILLTKHLVEQQPIELIDSTKRRWLRWCSKFSSNKQQQQQQHSVQVHILRKLRWHETSADTTYKCPLRDGTRTAFEAYRSVFQLYDAKIHHREELTCTITMLTRGLAAKTYRRRSSSTINSCRTEQQQGIHSSSTRAADEQRQQQQQQHVTHAQGCPWHNSRDRGARWRTRRKGIIIYLRPTYSVRGPA